MTGQSPGCGDHPTGQPGRYPSADLAEWLAMELARARTAGTIKDTVALAKASGVTRQTISRILNKWTEPTEATIARLAEALGVRRPQWHHGRLHRDLEELWRTVVPYLGALPPHVVAATVEIYQRAKSMGRGRSTESTHL